jgi:uncharacterized protein
MVLHTEEPLGREVVQTIHRGDVEALERLLAEHPGLENARLGNPMCGMSRTLLHVVTDWPGHFPRGAETVKALVAAGADVNARFTGPHTETPLHWAASSDDVAVLDALLDAGADIEAPGAVIAGGTPMADATAFGQWNAARRLLERGASTTLGQAAALGLLDRIEACFKAAEPPTPERITEAFWCACHGGQRAAAEHLLERGADLNWVGWDRKTPLDIAEAAEAEEVVAWLRSLGGKSATSA